MTQVSTDFIGIAFESGDLRQIIPAIIFLLLYILIKLYFRRKAIQAFLSNKNILIKGILSTCSIILLFWVSGVILESTVAFIFAAFISLPVLTIVMLYLTIQDDDVREDIAIALRQ